ncbi:MAG: hypothetical protein IJQ34_07535 [Kiritimatiellae bacterium]|nr:hypothetical protein [Kiritimatiellia bacterium]
MNPIRLFLGRIKKAGKRRPTTVKTIAMGREREFAAWDIGDDTFIFENEIIKHLGEHPSVLIVEKSSLKKKTPGRVFTMTTGNHSVAAFPLLDGRFWKLSRVPKLKQGDVLMKEILCSNIVAGKLEISQRDVPSKRLYSADEWLLSDKVGFGLGDVVMGDRNDITLDHYRQLGQEWRVKPLAWTIDEMKVALAGSKKRISSKIRYYHSMKGVHFMTFATFKTFADLASKDMEAFVKVLRELVSVFEGNLYSFTRQPKLRGHHEIELFGLKKGVALEKIIPELERLMEAITLGKIEQQDVIKRIGEIVSLYESLLASPDFANDEAKACIELLYMSVTGEIYSRTSEGATPAFDDRRTAIPGATYIDGRPVMHPGADDRSEVLLSNIRSLMSKDEMIEYANVYELRVEGEDSPIGEGMTREIVYKTNRGPLEHSMIEKRLSKSSKDYASYMLSRIECFKALGITLSEYRVLRRRRKSGHRTIDYYIRRRLDGEPMDSIPANYFCNVDDSSIEEKEVVLALATLMGDAAAQNMAMKKFDPATESPLYGVGKEIYEFEYDIIAERVVPKFVSTCSVRGSFGWPNLSMDDENLNSMMNFYLGYYAHALKEYQKKHNVSMAEVAERFMGGFEFRTHAMEWQLSVMRDKLENFKPALSPVYKFDKKWRFALWSLERQERRLPVLRRLFFRKVELEEERENKEINENLRDNSEPIFLD